MRSIYLILTVGILFGGQVKGDKESRKLIYEYALNGDKSALEKLIQGGADINEKNESGQTALLLTVNNAHKNLSLNGEDIITKESNVSDHYPGGTSPQFVAAKLLIDNGADVNATDLSFDTPLTRAAKNGYFDIVRLLIENRANVNSANMYGNTALILISDNVDETIRGEIPGHSATVKLLIKSGANVSAENELHETALFWANVNGHVEVVEELIKAGTDVNRRTSDVSPLLRAMWRGGTIQMVQLFIENGANVNEVNSENNTPLHFASSQGQGDYVEMLVEHGANIDAVNSNGDTPLLLAAKTDHHEVMKLLIEKGANVTAAGRHGETPLLILAQIYNRMPESIRTQLDVLDLLIKKGANVNAAVDGITALHGAAWLGNIDLVRKLLEYGADRTIKNKQNETPKEHLANKYEDPEKFDSKEREILKLLSEPYPINHR